MYSDKILDHFHHPRHVGEIEHPAAVIESVNPVCGDTLKLWVEIKDGRITQATFKAQGCVPAMACGSWLADWLTGKNVQELPALSAEAIEADLGGLPVASRHAATLAAECFRRLVEKITS